MNWEKECCRIVADDDGRIIRWVCRKLQMPEYAENACCAIGFMYRGKLIGGVIYGNYRPNHDVWLTIYTEDKHWCSRRILKIIFNIAFNFLNCRRVSILVTSDNEASLSLNRRLGFKKEGLLRQFRENGKDAYILGMLKNECKFL